MNINLKRFLLQIFDFNDNKKLDKLEIFVALCAVVLIEIFAEIISKIFLDFVNYY
tara:strand:+ start:472 stop:636 length:165 start_codon:yes stop_codon:yes gene_type:complete